MRLTLLICISLVCNLLHAAAMPVMGLDHAPTHATMSMESHAVTHQGASESAHHATLVYCPDESSYCCGVTTLQSGSSLNVTPSYRNAHDTLLLLHPSSHKPDALFRPPKPYLSFTG